MTGEEQMPNKLHYKTVKGKKTYTLSKTNTKPAHYKFIKLKDAKEYSETK